MIVASREPKAGGDGKASEETMTFDAATRIWRGRECLGVEDLIAEGIWPASGKKSLDGQAVLLGITWKPTPGRRVHPVSHLGHLAGRRPRCSAPPTIRPRRTKPSSAAAGCPPGSMPSSMASSAARRSPRRCSAAWTPRSTPISRRALRALMNAVENTLKHTHGALWPRAHGLQRPDPRCHQDGLAKSPLGSSGIQIRFETDLIIEGIRPGRVVRVRPGNWPQVNVPREEYLGTSSH